MILFALAALAAPDLPVLGELDTHTAYGIARPDGSVELSAGDATATLAAPDDPCTAELALGDDGLRVRWICGAKTDAFGSVAEVTWIPGRPAPAAKLRDGVAWLQARIETEAREDPVTANGLAAQYAGRLQYAATPEQREALLVPLVDAAIRQAESDRTQGDSLRAGARLMAFLQSPPIWELERPWDHANRIPIGPTAGNRPLPERNGWLSPTPANQQRLRRMVSLLHTGGHPSAAEELARRLVLIAPEDGEAHLLLGDILWAASDRDGAREAYTTARDKGAAPARVDRRLQPG